MRWLKYLGVVVLALPCLFLALLGGSFLVPPASSTPVSQDARTRYPIVLAHGVMGFAYIGRQSYWRDIPETLRAHGAQVHVTQVSAFNSSEVRGEQLLAQVERIRRESGADKVHLIGHSHGSVSVRYVAGLRPQWVASVTSVAGPTTGSEVADWLARQMDEGAVSATVLLAMGQGVGHLINWASGTSLPLDGGAAVRALTASSMAAFNQRFPAGVPNQPCGQGQATVHGVDYYSWGSVGQFYRAANPADYLMWLSSLTFKREVGSQNDGLVGRCASHLGLVVRDDYPMNHFQSVNQLFGLAGPGVDPVALFLAHARRLKQAGG